MSWEAGLFGTVVGLFCTVVGLFCTVVGPGGCRGKQVYEKIFFTRSHMLAEEMSLDLVEVVLVEFVVSRCIKRNIYMYVRMLYIYIYIYIYIYNMCIYYIYTHICI